MKTGSNDFDRFLSQISTDLPGVLSYFDDIIVHGTTKEEFYEHLCGFLEKLQKYDLHLN